MWNTTSPLRLPLSWLLGGGQRRGPASRPSMLQQHANYSSALYAPRTRDGRCANLAPCQGVRLLLSRIPVSALCTAPSYVRKHLTY